MKIADRDQFDEASLAVCGEEIVFAHVRADPSSAPEYIEKERKNCGTLSKLSAISVLFFC